MMRPHSDALRLNDLMHRKITSESHGRLENGILRCRSNVDSRQLPPSLTEFVECAADNEDAV
jgi:hypothetical protein